MRGASIPRVALSHAVRDRLAHYGALHREPRTRATHDAGIPLIALAVLGLLGRVPLPFGLDLGLVAWGAATLYYVRLDRWLGGAFALAALGLWALGLLVPFWLLILAFLAGWLLQYAGHLCFERNRPAFHQDLEHLLVGPLWIFARAVGAIER